MRTAEDNRREMVEPPRRTAVTRTHERSIGEGHGDERSREKRDERQERSRKTWFHN